MSESAIPIGLCQCGCGEKTRVAAKSSTVYGWTKGQPYRFVAGHGSRVRPLKGWKIITDQKGYRLIHLPDNPRATCGGYVFAHIPICEKALGKSLPVGAEVHHIDENKANNSHNNLVICESRAYHRLLHRRMRALKACGHANWRKCLYNFISRSIS